MKIAKLGSQLSPLIEFSLAFTLDIHLKICTEYLLTESKNKKCWTNKLPKYEIEGTLNQVAKIYNRYMIVGELNLPLSDLFASTFTVT